MRQEDRIGRLEPGYEADFLCFDLATDGFFLLNYPAVHAVYADSRARCATFGLRARRCSRNRTSQPLANPQSGAKSRAESR